MPPPVRPDHVPLDRVKRDLTSGLIRQGDGWSKNAPTYPLKDQIDDQGRYVITYTFSALPVADPRSNATNLRLLNQAQRQAVEHNFREREKIANVRFERVEWKDRETANIRFGQAHAPDWTGRSQHSGDHRWIMLSDRFPDESYRLGGEGYQTVDHEISHAMGLTHPGAAINRERTDVQAEESGGRNPLYTTDSTGMSYNEGILKVRGLGPYDAVVLRAPEMYGPSEAGLDNEQAIDPTETTLICADVPVSLTIDSRYERGYLNVRLAETKTYPDQFHGYLWNSGSTERPVGIRFVPGTQIRNFRMAEESRINLDIIGNELANHMQGGSGSDRLSPYGGDDRLAGGRGADAIVINRRSGFGNIMTDFNPQEGDTLKVEGNRINRITLVPVTDDQGQHNTQAIFSDNVRALASLRVEGVPPGVLKDRIESTGPVAVDVAPADTLKPPPLPPPLVRSRRR